MVVGGGDEERSIVVCSVYGAGINELCAVIATAQELDVAVIAYSYVLTFIYSYRGSDIPFPPYSPLGKGFLTGTIKSIDDIPGEVALKLVLIITN